MCRPTCALPRPVCDRCDSKTGNTVTIKHEHVGAGRGQPVPELGPRRPYTLSDLSPYPPAPDAPGDRLNKHSWAWAWVGQSAQKIDFSFQTQRPSRGMAQLTSAHESRVSTGTTGVTHSAVVDQKAESALKRQAGATRPPHEAHGVTLSGGVGDGGGQRVKTWFALRTSLYASRTLQRLRVSL